MFSNLSIPLPFKYIIATNASSLDLSANSYTPSDEFYLALNQKPKLKKLHLNGNSLGSNGCTLLLEMLPKDSQLEELGIKTCDVGPSGCSKRTYKQ